MTAATVSTSAGRRATRYLHVGRFYLNERLGPLRAWRILWEQLSDFLGSEGKQVGPDSGPEGLFKVASTSKLLLRYLFARYFGSGTAMELPLSGDLIIERLSGAYKLLDIDGNRVYTIMPSEDLRSKLSERVRSAKRVSGRSFAPDFRGADLDQGWLAEEYIPGEHPTGFRGCSQRFEEYYLPLLVDFLRAEEPVVGSFSDYVESLVADIFASDGLLPLVEPGLRDEITEFVTEYRARLEAQLGDAQEIARVLSHGDFFSGNVIIRDDGPPRAIDWATTGTRSPTYDLYYLVMNHCVRVLDPSQRQRRFSEMLEVLRSALGEEDPDRLAALQEALSTAPELRWLFYLECVHVPLMHCVDPEDRYIRSLAMRIRWFKEYEQAVKD